MCRYCMLGLTRAVGTCATAVPPAWAATRKPWDRGVTGGIRAALQHPSGVGRGDLTQKQVFLAALGFVSLVCPQQLQKWDYRCWRALPYPFLIVSPYGPPVRELPCPFLSPLKQSASAPSCADKLQKFTHIWVKKCILLPILLLWALVNTSSIFTLPSSFGIL